LLAEGGQSIKPLAYQKALVSRERLVALNPANLQWRSELASSYLLMGDFLAATARHEDAEAVYRSSASAFETLVARNRRSSNRSGICRSPISKSATCSSRKGNRRKRAAYEKCILIRERLVLADPSNLLWQREQALLCSAGAGRRPH
jgi:hypothetical protein